MARLFTGGAETGDASDFKTHNNMQASSSVYRTGAYSYWCVNGAYGTFRNFKNATTELYMGIALRTNKVPSNDGYLFSILDAASAYVLTVTKSSSGGILQFRLGNTSGTILATSITPVYLNFVYLELYFLKALSGRLIAKLDGVQEVDYSGDTRGSSGNPNNIYVQSAGYGAGDTWFDDIVVNDTSGSGAGANNTWPGVVRLQPIRPSAAGDSTQFTRGGTDRGANWDQVDEVPSAHTDYIYSTTVDQKDLYNAGTFTVPAGATVKNLIVVATSLYDSGAGNIAVGLKSTNEDFSADQAIGATVKAYEHAVSLDPATGGAWGQTAIDGVQIGVKCR